MFAPDLFPDENSPRPDVLADPRFLSGQEQSALFDWCLAHVAWEESTVNYGGRQIPVPRRVAWYGDANYAYSGMSHVATPMPAPLRAVADRIEAWLSTRGHAANFNSLLLNHYRDGKDSIGMHADDEPELGDQPTIASLSLGASRTFIFRHNRRGVQLSESLPGGSLLVMRGQTQREWKHGIPKEPAEGPRINLTFRNTRTSQR